MKQPEHVSIALEKNGRTIPFLDEDGYVGHFEYNDKLVLRVVSPPHVAAFDVDGTKQINWKQYTDTPDGRRVFQMNIRIDKDKRGAPCTKYPMNNMRLIEFPHRNTFTVWEAALTAQNGDFFLAVHAPYHAACFSDGWSVVCPFFEKGEHYWPDLLSFLRKQYYRHVSALPPIEEYTPKEEVGAPLRENEAQVLWWSFAQNYGLVRTREGVASVHWTQAPRLRRLRFLGEGEIVRFESLITHPRRSIKLEARKISRP